ncbi:MAG: aminotransferase class V-fold PLP-dependent enzyme, partial [Faecalibacterium prausnitzii]
SQGVEALHEKETALTRLFYEKIVHAPGVKIYGSFDETDRAPIVSLNFGDEDAARAADILWEDYGICVRAGAHCAPLIHKALGTVEQGMVRFSFSHQNTEAEVLRAAEAVCELAEAEREKTIHRSFICLYRPRDGLGERVRRPGNPGAAHPAAQ